jgi:hypothetical protein
MGFLNWLGIKKYDYVEDDFFGRMLFFEGYGRNLTGYFEASKFFMPLAQEVECYIEIDRSGPLQEQRDFYCHVEAKYEEVERKVRSALESEIRKENPKFGMGNFRDQFKLAGITIPDVRTSNKGWLLWYDALIEPEYLYSVQLQESEVIDVVVEG